jgi:LCP family protein required for cell wall assembly
MVSGTGYALLSWSDSSIRRIDVFPGLSHRPPESAAGSTTFLLVGSDNRMGMSVAQMQRLHVGGRHFASGRRADTMMLVHISERHDAVSVVSLPRDWYVEIPAHRSSDGDRVSTRRDKLNVAYSVGGPRLAVATVERATGVRVDHYVEVDFTGFVRLVNAIGGVDVCAPTPLRDHKAGLRLPAGVSHVDGRTGLAYVRARHLDARADLGRVERQQQFLGSMIHRVTSRDVLLDPRALVRFLDAALRAVRVDRDLRQQDLLALAIKLRHISGRDISFRTVPIANPSYRVPGAGAVALWDRPAARRIFAAMREDRAPSSQARRRALTVDPAQIKVRVYNGAGVTGLGRRAESDLAGVGFAVTGSARNWTSSGLSRTIIRYDARYTESIRTLAASLPGAALRRVVGLGSTLEVVVGSSYDGARDVTVRTPRPSNSVTPAHTVQDGPCG